MVTLYVTLQIQVKAIAVELYMTYVRLFYFLFQNFNTSEQNKYSQLFTVGRNSFIIHNNRNRADVRDNTISTPVRNDTEEIIKCFNPK